MSGTDKFTIWLSKSYIWLFNLAVAIFVGLPFLAPVFMNAGLELPAKVVYTMYSPLCHQFPFRSLFLFGEQPYYPRELAGLPYEITYEDVEQRETINILTARKFIGDDYIGYKVALCERDLALYGAILVFGLLFVAFRRRIKALKWYIWLVIGILPMALDGVSQLPGLMSSHLPEFLARESTPLLRYITGGLFGFTTAWYLYPMIEETMQDSVNYVMYKSEKVSVQEDRNAF